MVYKLNKVSKIALLLLFVLLVSGCRSQLEWLDNKIGEMGVKLQKGGSFEIGSGEGESASSSASVKGEILVLTDEAKIKIEEWVENHNLNRYGDDLDTLYIGGTPLFNEATGESLDRYEYILKNHPELIEMIK